MLLDVVLANVSKQTRCRVFNASWESPMTTARNAARSWLRRGHVTTRARLGTRARPDKGGADSRSAALSTTLSTTTHHPTPQTSMTGRIHGDDSVVSNDLGLHPFFYDSSYPHFMNLVHALDVPVHALAFLRALKSNQIMLSSISTRL
jgi:hypothetical protein